MVLQNRTNRMRVYTLAHDEVCAGGDCICSPVEHTQQVHDGKTGVVGVRQIFMNVPRSVHVPARGVSEDLPEVALKSRQIAADIRARVLVQKGS